MMSNTNEPKVLSSKDLADQLFDAALLQVKGDFREAARQVTIFLKDALVYAMSATVGDDAAKRVGESIVVALTSTSSP